MKRPASSGKLGISLFPFLDALICMMGGLIVILAAVNHSAAQQAVLKHTAEREKSAQLAAAPAPPTATPEPVVDDTAAKTLEALAETRDELAWRIEHLRSSREKTAHDLQYERLRLSSAENQVTQLKQQLAELSNALQHIQGTSAQQNQSRAQLAQTLEATRQQLEAAKQRVARAQQEAANKKPSYAVVPYEGPNRTKRRPIYIECTAEKIIIQPEGIIVLPSDLAGPSGPGNPLASTIRAIREGLLATSPDPSSPDAEPYPLFLVRPNGIVAYYEAREAMASWAHEIGYQVVEQDWPLTFPPADPNLALRGNQALADARQRFEWLAKQNPELAKRASGAPKTYRVSPTGGGLVAEGGSGGGGASVPSWSESQGRGGAGGRGFDSSSQATNSGRYSDSTDVPNGGANSLAGLNPNTRIGSTYSGGGGGMSSAAGNGQYQKGGLGSSQYAPGSAPTDVYGNLNPVMDAGGFGGGNSARNGTGSSGRGMNGQGQYSAGGQGGSAMQNASISGGPMNGNSTGPNGQGSQGQGAAGQASAGQPGGANGMQGSASNGSSSGGASAQGGGGSQGGGSSGGTSQQFGAASSGQKSSGQNDKNAMNTSMANAAGPGAAPTTRQYGDLSQKQPMPSDGVLSDEISPINTPTPKRDTKSLASTKGKDWAVMRNGNGRSAVTRPVRMRVTGNQLVLLADATANEGEQVIPIYDETGQAIPGLVQSVEKRIDKWGLAGKGLYWSPELVFDVTPDGETRYADLQTLLDNSGWIVRRKQ